LNKWLGNSLDNHATFIEQNGHRKNAVGEIGEAIAMTLATNGANIGFTFKEKLKKNIPPLGVLPVQQILPIAHCQLLRTWPITLPAR
jgi:hypothetical protein